MTRAEMEKHIEQLFTTGKKEIIGYSRSTKPAKRFLVEIVDPALTLRFYLPHDKLILHLFGFMVKLSEVRREVPAALKDFTYTPKEITLAYYRWLGNQDWITLRTPDLFSLEGKIWEQFVREESFLHNSLHDPVTGVREA